MFKPVKKYIGLLFFTSLLLVNAQYSDNQFGISASANYTTSARLFLNPNAIQRAIREINTELVDVYSGSIELRYRLNESIIFGIGSEYIEKVSKERNIIGFPPQFAGIEVEEGFKMIPVEVSVYYHLPFSTESFKFFMGGGLGIYFGEYIRNVNVVSVETVNREFSWGIHGRIGMDYLITDFFSVRGEMKFRDPEFEMENKYTKESFVYRNQVIDLPEEAFTTKVNIDGMTFSIGIVLHL